MIDWQAVSAVATVIASAVGIVTALLAYVTFRRSKEVEFQEIRPFMIPSLSLQVVNGKKRLYLIIRNFGDTPAKNVRLQFAEGQAWNWVKDPSYPFLSEGGISAIGPSETVTYFLGELTPRSPLNDIEKRDIDVVVTCDHPVLKERITDTVRMSLQDNRYKAKT
jgi:hypothetical protein